MHTDAAAYAIDGLESVVTPALAIYPDFVDANIETTLRLAGGNANRWRPHIKTAKLGFTMRRLVDHGVVNFKCSTSLELLVSCQSGARDVVVAYPMVGANADRVRGIAGQFPGVRISILVENEAQAEIWEGTAIGLFIDVNPGMDRTGIDQNRIADIVGLAERLGSAFRGLHYYDGQIHTLDEQERQREAFRGYERLESVIASVEEAGCKVGEVITSGTPALPCGLVYPGFRDREFVHRVSPGTVVYNDLKSMEQLRSVEGYLPAVVVIARVVSHPAPDRFTCDAGHKSVSADAGVPTCAVLGRPDLKPLAPSEEHLPVQVAPRSARPAIGDFVYLVPKHVCPTVNNFDDALIVKGGHIIASESVTARGHESPLVLYRSLETVAAGLMQ